MPGRKSGRENRGNAFEVPPATASRSNEIAEVNLKRIPTAGLRFRLVKIARNQACGDNPDNPQSIYT